MSTPKISIIVPIYNVAEYLEQGIKSVVDQSYRDFELILINDGSRDNSGEICDRYAKEYSCIEVIHQPNQGVSAARDAGLNAARGEWIAFLDGDDELCEEALHRASIALAECGDADVDMLFFDAQRYDASGEMHYAYPFKESLNNRVLSPMELIFTDSYFRAVIWGGLYRRDFLNNYNLRFLKGAINSQDTIFTAFAQHYAKRIYLSHIDFVRVNYREGSASRSWSRERLKQYILNIERIEREVARREIEFCRAPILNRLIFSMSKYLIKEIYIADETDLIAELKRALQSSSLYPVALSHLCSSPRTRLNIAIFNNSLRVFAYMNRRKG